MKGISLEALKATMRSKLSEAQNFKNFRLFHVADLIELFAKEKNLKGIDLRQYTLEYRTNLLEKGIEIDTGTEFMIKGKKYNHSYWFPDCNNALILYFRSIPIAGIFFRITNPLLTNKTIIEVAQIQGAEFVQKPRGESTMNNPYISRFNWKKVLIVCLEVYTLMTLQHITEIRIQSAEHNKWIHVAKEKVLQRIYNTTPIELGYDFIKPNFVYRIKN